MKSTTLLVAGLSSVLILSACGTTGFRSSSNSPKDKRSANASDPINNEKHAGKRDVQFKGTIVYYKSHGGRYVISSDRGEAYLPVNLPSSYKNAGLRVWVRGTVYSPSVDGNIYELKIDDIERL